MRGPEDDRDKKGRGEGERDLKRGGSQRGTREDRSEWEVEA